MSADRISDAAIFPWLDAVLKNGDAGAAFEQLAGRFRRDKQYRALFDVRLMEARHELGLPLVSAPAINDLPAELQERYQEASVRAAREVGELVLTDGNIPQAWPYFRAIGDTVPVVEALDAFDMPYAETPESRAALGSTIHVAFQEGLHPRKGFELILKHYGLCRAITMFSSYPQREGRDESLRLLVRSLHGELLDNLKRAIADVEGRQPETDSIGVLIEGRGWLFENNAQHTDSSHIGPVLEFSAELDDRETLRLAVEIAEYATRLAPLFQYSGDPPFDRVYEDRCIYLKALLGRDAELAVKHFEEKAADADPEQVGSRPAEILVELLMRLGRYGDAVATFRRYLMDAAPDTLSCPSLVQLCQMAGDFEQLKQVAKEQGDPLSYMAALIQGPRREGE